MLKNFRFIRIHLAAAAVLMGGILVLPPMAAAEPSGSIYDASGRYQGRTDKNGRRYDASGRYLGREDFR